MPIKKTLFKFELRTFCLFTWRRVVILSLWGWFESCSACVCGERNKYKISRCVFPTVASVTAVSVPALACIRSFSHVRKVTRRRLCSVYIFVKCYILFVFSQGSEEKPSILTRINALLGSALDPSMIRREFFGLTFLVACAQFVVLFHRLRRERSVLATNVWPKQQQFFEWLGILQQFSVHSPRLESAKPAVFWR